MFGALKRGFRSMAGLILVRNVVGELRPKRTLAASRGFLAAARLSCKYREQIKECSRFGRHAFNSYVVKMNKFGITDQPGHYVI